MSVMELLKTHLWLIVPLGAGCVDIACGSQTKPLRTLLLQLIDSQLPPQLEKVYCMTLLCFRVLLFTFFKILAV